MPVLLGDLFLGKFYKTLHEYAREDTLTIYLEFMKELNRERIGQLEQSPKCAVSCGKKIKSP